MQFHVRLVEVRSVKDGQSKDLITFVYKIESLVSSRDCSRDLRNCIFCPKILAF